MFCGPSTTDVCLADSPRETSAQNILFPLAWEQSIAITIILHYIRSILHVIIILLTRYIGYK